MRPTSSATNPGHAVAAEILTDSVRTFRSDLAVHGTSRARSGHLGDLVGPSDRVKLPGWVR